jgi:hypothetical protein
MDAIVTGFCVFTCQVHSDPVFVSFFTIQVKPRQMLCFSWKLALTHRDVSVMLGNISAQAP